jgi:hypothetical protein
MFKGSYIRGSLKKTVNYNAGVELYLLKVKVPYVFSSTVGFIARREGCYL